MDRWPIQAVVPAPDSFLEQNYRIRQRITDYMRDMQKQTRVFLAESNVPLPGGDELLCDLHHLLPAELQATYHTALRTCTYLLESLASDGRRLVNFAQIHNLPIEILGLIFQAGIDEPLSLEFPAFERDNHPFEVLVSHVCRHWRAVALSTPSLWTIIHITSSQDVDRASHYLTRSRSCPLDVTLDLKESTLESLSTARCEAIKILCDHARRWRSLSIQSWSKTDCDTTKLKEYLVLCDAPKLEYLELSRTEIWQDIEHLWRVSDKFSNGNIFGRGSSELSHLCLRGCGLLMPSSVDTLRRLVIQVALDEPDLHWSDLQNLLGGFNRLESLAIRGKITVYHALLTDQKTAILRTLVSLEIDSADVVFLLSMIDSPSLRSLRVDGSSFTDDGASKFWDLLTLPTRTPRYPDLQSLRLYAFSEHHAAPLMHDDFIRAYPNLTEIGLMRMHCRTFLLFLADKCTDLKEDQVKVWPKLRVLCVYIPHNRLLRQLIMSRIAVGCAVQRVESTKSFTSRMVEWLAKNGITVHLLGEEADFPAPIGWDVFITHTENLPCDDDGDSWTSESEEERSSVNDET